MSNISCQVVGPDDPPPFRAVLADVADNGHQLVQSDDADWEFAIIENATDYGRHGIVLHVEVEDVHVVLSTTHRALLLAVKQLMMDPYPDLVREYFHL